MLEAYKIIKSRKNLPAKTIECLAANIELMEDWLQEINDIEPTESDDELDDSQQDDSRQDGEDEDEEEEDEEEEMEEGDVSNVEDDPAGHSDDEVAEVKVSRSKHEVRKSGKNSQATSNRQNTHRSRAVEKEVNRAASVSPSSTIGQRREPQTPERSGRHRSVSPSESTASSIQNTKRVRLDETQAQVHEPNSPDVSNIFDTSTDLLLSCIVMPTVVACNDISIPENFFNLENIPTVTNSTNNIEIPENFFESQNNPEIFFNDVSVSQPTNVTNDIEIPDNFFETQNTPRVEGEGLFYDKFDIGDYDATSESTMSVNLLNMTVSSVSDLFADSQSIHGPGEDSGISGDFSNVSVANLNDFDCSLIEQHCKHHICCVCHLEVPGNQECRGDGVCPDRNG